MKFFAFLGRMCLRLGLAFFYAPILGVFAATLFYDANGLYGFSFLWIMYSLMLLPFLVGGSWLMVPITERYLSKKQQVTGKRSLIVYSLTGFFLNPLTYQVFWEWGTGSFFTTDLFIVVLGPVSFLLLAYSWRALEHLFSLR